MKKSPEQIRSLKLARQKAVFYSTANLMWMLKELIDIPCFYCGQPANYYKFKKGSTNIFTCTPKARQCPGFKAHHSAKIKKSYTQERKRKLSETMKVVQNKKSVAEKKSNTMTLLHNGDCIPCRSFQERYRAGQKSRRTDKYEQNLIYQETARKNRERKNKNGVLDE